LQALAELGGRDYLVTQATSNPAAFLALLGRCLPKDIRLEGHGKITVNLLGVAGRNP